MELCSDGHREICFISGDCPACNLIKEKSDLEEDEIYNLKETIENMKEVK